MSAEAKTSKMDKNNRLDKVIVSPNETISDSISVLDRSGLGILFLAEEDRKLVGIITDGDIRRAMLRNVSFDQPCIMIAHRDPVTAPPQVSPLEALHLMDSGRSFIINNLPVVDAEGRIVGLILRSDLVAEEPLDLSAVIMAGGFGTRLLPLTEELPKPMLLVGGTPLMELIIERLRQAGIRKVNVTTNYKQDKIIDYFGDGHAYGVDIKYVTEDQPLGTAGALGLMEKPSEPLLIINGDILTRIDFRSMVTFHREHKAELTVAVRSYEVQVPYGVIECDGPQVRRLREKPVYNFLVNAGVYLMEPTVHQYIPNGQRFDMTDLIQHLLDMGRPVVSFPIVEYWLDIGQHSDYEQAKEDMKNGRLIP